MKKLTVILCAGLVALAAVSCKKGEKPAAPMTQTQVKQKVADVALNVLNEVDPDNWKTWGQTGLGLVNELYNLDDTEDGLDALRADLESLFVHEDVKDNFKTVTTIIKLSKVTGDLTIENNILKYTQSTNPLSLTMAYKGKTYKAQVESAGESSTALEVNSYESESRSETISVHVPQTAAIHVTENGSLYLDLVVNPVVQDKNNNGKLDEGDAISGGLSLQIPSYKLAISNLLVSEEAMSGSLELTHGNTSVAYLDGELKYDFAPTATAVKSLIPSGLKLDDVNIKSFSLMGGQAIVKASAKVQEVKNINTQYKTESEANTAAQALNRTIQANLFFDNNSTVQASFVAMVVADEQNSGYKVVPGVHFYDGSADVPFSELITEEDKAIVDPVAKKYDEILGKLTRYFHDLLPKKNKDNQVQ